MITRKKFLIVYIIALLISVIIAAKPSIASAAPSQLDAMRSINLVEDTSQILNPERGWHAIVGTSSISYSAQKLKNEGVNIILLEADLGNFLTSPISDDKLLEIRNAFDYARKGGFTVIFRAGYDFDGESNCEPKDINIILNHINQLKPVFFENEDVLFAIQAGFFGPWGEWHSSYYGDPINVESQKQLVNALLAASPQSVFIQLRRPMFIRQVFVETGTTLSEENAFGVSALSRVGFHNDAVLSTASDMGTYVQVGYDRAAELTWVNNHAKYTPFVAESCYLSNLSDPNNAVYELGLLHAESLNYVYFPEVLNKWRSTTYNNINTYDYISQKMGYRFVLSSASLNTEITQGKVLRLKLNFKNDGFGNLLKEKKVELVLSNNLSEYRATIAEDARKWYKENGTMDRDFYFSIPSTLPVGNWKVSLNICSKYDSIKSNPNYSVRFSNVGTWDAVKGYNTLGDIYIGNGTGDAREFKQITRTQAEILMGGQSTTNYANLSISTDSDKLILKASGLGLSGKQQFYIDVDNNSATGYKNRWNNGFDYLIENGRLYRYSGINQDWGWSFLQNLWQSYSDTEIIEILPMSAISVKPGSLVQVAFLSNDNYLVCSPSTNIGALKYAIPNSPEKQINVDVSSDATNIYFTISNNSKPNKFQVFIDSDANSKTGFPYSFKGGSFEYLIENGNLYSYSGKKNSWNWSFKQTLNVTKSDNTIIITLPKSYVTLSNTFSFGYVENDDIQRTFPYQGCSVKVVTVK